MAEWPFELMTRRFAPREVAQITGVSEAQQRLWASRHFDFRESIEPAGKHRRWTWEGVQTLAVFADAMDDLRDANRAAAVARGTDSGKSRTQHYLYDGREDESDTLILFYFDHPVLAGDSIGTAKGVADLYKWANTDVRPKRVYSYNLSDLQRRLCDRLGMPLASDVGNNASGGAVA